MIYNTYPNATVSGINVNHLYPLWTGGGFYCGKDTVITTNAGYPVPKNWPAGTGSMGSECSIYIVPLINGNINNDKCIILKDQTPQQITEFIQANQGTAGGQYFGEGDYGIFGSTENNDSNNWNLITSDTSDTFMRFAVTAVTNSGICAMVKAPYNKSNLDKYKTSGIQIFKNLTLNNSNKQTMYIDSSNPIMQSEYNAITLLLYNFNPDSSSN